MINKQSLWFVTLFAFIIILSIYYFKSDEPSLSISKLASSESYSGNSDNTNSNLDVLKISSDEEAVSKINEYQEILLDDEATLEEKNNAYDSIEVISQDKKLENDIMEMIKSEFSYDSFVKIKNNQISVVISSDVHSNEIANTILKKVKEKDKNSRYVTIKFDTN